MTNEQHVTFNKWMQTPIGAHYYNLSLKYYPLPVYIEIAKPSEEIEKNRKYIGGAMSSTKLVHFYV